MRLRKRPSATIKTIGERSKNGQQIANFTKLKVLQAVTPANTFDAHLNLSNRSQCPPPPQNENSNLTP